MPALILTLCGAGVGTSAILKVTAERALARLGIVATVTATDVAHVDALAEDAQVVLATAEHARAVRRSYAQVIVIDSILDQEEVAAKLGAALG